MSTESDIIGDVNWAAFRTTFGTGAGVPARLAALNDPDPAVRRDASWDLAEMLHHQGVLSSAAIPAVRWLVPVALSPEAPGREDALVKLLYLAAAAAPDENGLIGELSAGVLNGLTVNKPDLIAALAVQTKPSFLAGLVYLLAAISSRLSDTEKAIVGRLPSAWSDAPIISRLAHIVVSHTLGFEDPDVVRDEVLEALEAS